MFLKVQKRSSDIIHECITHYNFTVGKCITIINTEIDPRGPLIVLSSSTNASFKKQGLEFVLAKAFCFSSIILYW